jgi:hypothetical protein
MSRFSPRASLRQALLSLLLFSLAVTALAPAVASAAIRSCRADPIVWLSNGDTVQMTVDVAASASDVRRITYTLHAPAGTSITRIIYTGGVLQSKEQVVLYADQPHGHYITDTVVTTRPKRIPVTANTAAAGEFRGSVAGRDGDHLILNFTAGR